MQGQDVKRIEYLLLCLSVQSVARTINDPGNVKYYSGMLPNRLMH